MSLLADKTRLFFDQLAHHKQVRPVPKDLGSILAHIKLYSILSPFLPWVTIFCCSNNQVIGND